MPRDSARFAVPGFAQTGIWLHLANVNRDNIRVTFSAKLLFSYQEVIRMGDSVTPLLLRDLEQEPDRWFHALRVITGANPVPVEESGNLDKMAAAWLRWGRQHGYR